MKHILYDEKAIAKRVADLGAEITDFYREKPLTVVVLLNGGLVFAADLLRAVSLSLRLDTCAVSSYQGLGSTGKLEFRSRLKLDVTGREILLVDDILDTGLTIREMKNYLLSNGAAGVRVCVLLDKVLSDPSKKLSAPDWYGFRIPDEFVVGYGLDADEQYRNLPYIGSLQ